MEMHQLKADTLMVGISNQTVIQGEGYLDATAESGFTYGGYFQSKSSSGYGVYGYATAESGDAYGGKFQSKSSDGRGVYGIASAETGVTYGGFFLSTSSSGYGIYAQSEKFGVKGIASNLTGSSYGGYFQSTSRSGHGVYGITTDESGLTYGGKFKSSSSQGYGVSGVATAETGVNYGGHFLSRSTSGRGVRGHVTATSGNTYGGAFNASNSLDGIGAWAKGGKWDFYAASTTSSKNYGSASSIRWKNNIVPINLPLEKIAAIRGVYFDWDSEHGGNHDVGCIAEEVGKVLPEIVVFEKNGIDAEGMDYSKLTPLLIEAIKALMAENNILTTKNNNINADVKHSII